MSTRDEHPSTKARWDPAEVRDRPSGKRCFGAVTLRGNEHGETRYDQRNDDKDAELRGALADRGGGFLHFLSGRGGGRLSRANHTSGNDPGKEKPPRLAVAISMPGGCKSCVIGAGTPALLELGGMIAGCSGKELAWTNPSVCNQPE